LNVSTLNEQATTNPAVAVLTGMYRAHQEALRTSEDYRKGGATQANDEGILQELRKGVGKVLEVSATTPTIVPSSEQDYLGKEYSVEESREVGVDSDDLY